MAVLCGWASIGETGRASNNKAGDNTKDGHEVKTGNWYDFGQTEVFRWKNRERAKKYASIIKYWCNDADVGYDQYNRTTLGKWCKEHNYSYKVDVKVETDCSRMVADGINCTMGKEVIKIDETFYTGNLGEKLMKTGLFTKHTSAKYVDDDDYLMVGDIINNPTRHVITALANGSKVKVKKQKYTGELPKLPMKADGYRYLCKGDKGKEVEKLQRFLKWYGTYTGKIDGSAGKLTDQAIWAYQKREGLREDGYFGKQCLRRAKIVKK